MFSDDQPLFIFQINCYAVLYAVRKTQQRCNDLDSESGVQEPTRGTRIPQQPT